MKKLLRNFLIGSGVVAICGILGASIGYKIDKPFKPAFYNFKSYMSEDNQDILREKFTYTQFSEINEFNNALINNKAAAGVGTDFLAAQLVKKGLLAKIDYSILFGDETLKDNKERMKNAVRLFLRDEIWNHLAQYDDFINQNDSSNNTNTDRKELWEYFFPYYSQDTVIAYNVRKKPIKTDARQDRVDELSGISTEWMKKEFLTSSESYNSFINVLNSVKYNNYNGWIITDAMRDNMLYGSSYWLLPNNQRTSDHFTGEVEQDTYKTLINSFKQLIKDGTGYDVRDNRHISFEGDGLELLNQLVNPKRPDINAAIMYNGDAIDAYYGSDNYPPTAQEEKLGITHDGDIKVIKPKQNLLLVDGIMLSSRNNDEDNYKYLEVLKDSVYNKLSDYYKETVGNKKIFPFKLDELDPNNQNFINAKTKITENAVAKTWKQIQYDNKAFKQLFDEENNAVVNNSKNSDLENLITSWSDIINLGLDNNMQYLEQYQKMQFITDDKIVNYDAKINMAPELLKNHFIAKYNLLLNLIIQNINNLDNVETKTYEEKVIVSLIKSNLEEVNEFLNNNENNIDTLGLYLGRKIGLIDISNEQNIEGWGNLTNFNYINYVPTQEIDYQLVLRNYFADVADGQDKNVIDIYKIDDITNPTIQLNYFENELIFRNELWNEKLNTYSSLLNNINESIQSSNAEVIANLWKQIEENKDSIIQNLYNETIISATNSNTTNRLIIFTQLFAKLIQNKQGDLAFSENYLQTVQNIIKQNNINASKKIINQIFQSTNSIIKEAWINNGIIEHKELEPVSEKILSESSQYYFMQTKS
ncbi:hypothetical protein [Mycoplasmopsis verecunda]|uniref:Spermidine/putrescine transport system substrate-binding protein n=1 Tax=Mycoplasmopsis verecunda TaxID=171291 RepID=A0A1T4KES6_9BACT|nr:hypothetical protein [Mycoplasmopsis verecunda]WPB54877.1 hypothetical protein SAM46_01835 [Mycoplasmopsis verecunda]SJZ40924.1 spermidine/putrescine transport system substrate-binding protein [Mycoplasmopsis verecunda]